MAIDPNYMTPNLRWGLFRKDHPEAPEPDFTLVNNDESGVPPDFQRDECGDPITGFIRCIIRYSKDGPIAATGYRGIPTSEKRKGGGKQDFAKNEESWMALCTMALGRSLKRAGYPDTTVDLRAFLLYGQRLAEIAAIGAGAAQPPQLTAATVDKVVTAIGVGTPDADRPEHRPEDEPHPDAFGGDGSSDDEPAEGEIVQPGGAETIAGADGSYPPSLAQVFHQLTADGRQALLMWLGERNFTPEALRQKRAALNQAVAYANRLLLDEQEKRNTPAEETAPAAS